MKLNDQLIPGSIIEKVLEQLELDADKNYRGDLSDLRQETHAICDAIRRGCGKTDSTFLNSMTDFQRFRDLLSVMNDEQLVRLAYRLRKAGKKETANQLEQVLATREQEAKDEWR